MHPLALPSFFCFLSYTLLYFSYFFIIIIIIIINRIRSMNVFIKRYLLLYKGGLLLEGQNSTGGHDSNV